MDSGAGPELEKFSDRCLSSPARCEAHVALVQQIVSMVMIQQEVSNGLQLEGGGTFEKKHVKSIIEPEGHSPK
jgi:hypothetical protein